MAVAAPQLGEFAGAGLNSGFLGRVTVLEREVKFLKAKVEEDSRWKSILEEWVMKNFAFDLHGVLLKKIQPDLYPNSQATLQKPISKGSKSSTVKNKTINKSEAKSTKTTPTPTTSRGRGGRKPSSPPKRRGRKRKVQDYSEYSEDEDLFNNLDGAFSDCAEDELDPRDLIITPDVKDRSCRRVMKTERVSPQEVLSDYECMPVALDEGVNDEYETEELPIGSESVKAGGTKNGGGSGSRGTKITRSIAEAEDKSQSEESSSDEESEEFKNSYPRKKMDWNLLSTYPNHEVMLKSFPLQRDWAIHTSCTALGKVKKYYYCKMCSKKGPIRIQVRYENPEGEVEILQNNHPHDHDYSKRRFLCDEMKSEIFTLYRAGLKNSTQIIEAIKTSKPDLKVPTAKQVTFLLKATRKQDTKIARKLKKQHVEDSLRKPQPGVVVINSNTPMHGSAVHQHVPSQTYTPSGGMLMGGGGPGGSGMQCGTLQNSHSGYGASSSSTPSIPTNQFTYDQQQLILQQFSHITNQSHHQQ